MFSERMPPFIKAALLGMGPVTVAMGMMFPSITWALLVSLIIAGLSIVVGYFAVRRIGGED